jgi:proteasome accessory factor C
MSRRPRADNRLRRILALVPWVAAHDGPSVDDVCTRFGLTPEELEQELEQLFLCGLYPFTPDSLIEVDVADGRVWIRFADAFIRPLRLTPAEGLAVLASADALLVGPEEDRDPALERGLAKLAALLGIDPDEAVDVELAPAPAERLVELRAAVADRRQVEIDYFSYGRNEWTTRVVDPHQVFNAAGRWYVSAYCHRVEDRRLFRLDRIGRATVLDATFPPPPAPAARVTFDPRPHDPFVVLELQPGARWVGEQYPNEGVDELPGGGTRVRLRISERAWLERLLLRLGPDGRVVAGDAQVGAEAAARLLRRYQGDPLP